MQQMQRMRATILNADVVGYAALMAADDVATVEALLDHVRRISLLVTHFDGRVIDATGDNLLAQFSRESAALRCASEILLAVGEYNQRQPEHRHMQFRIGLHSGDLLERDGRVYGDVVNIAARLQAAAPANGILLSEGCAARAGCAQVAPQGLYWFKNIPYAVPVVNPSVR